MTKFEPVEGYDMVHMVSARPIENGFIVERISSNGSGIIHCETAEMMAAVVESAFTQKN